MSVSENAGITERFPYLEFALRASTFFVVLVWEVLVHDEVSLLVDFQVVVMLKLMNRHQTSCLLHEQSILVDGAGARGLPVHLANFEDVVQTVKGDLYDLVVHHSQQVAKWLDAALRDEVPNLAWLEETS